MFKGLFFVLFYLTACTAFPQDSGLFVSKIDSCLFYNETAIYNKNHKVFDKALENANKSITYGLKSKNNLSVANGYFTLAIIYIDLKKYNDAIEKLIRSVSILNAAEPSAKLGLCYYNLGLCYMQKENFSRAESYFEKSISVYESIDLTNAKNTVKLQKALLYLEKNEDSVAEKTLEELVHLSKNKDTFKLQSEALYQLGQIKAKGKVNNLALNYFTRAYELSVENNDLEQQSKISKKMSEVYDQLSETKNSLAYLKIHTKLNDSIQSISKFQSQNTVSERVKVDEMMRSMEKLDKEKKEQEKAGKFSKLINILSIALITILSLLSLSLYKNNIIRNKSNELLREKNNELEIAKERIEKASKARSEFLSTVSHELRTPLNAINGISHILLEDKPKASQIEYLKSLKFSGNYLLTYINEILEINRIESNNIQIEKISFDIKELLHNIQNSLKEQASQNNNDFILYLDKDVPEFLIGDPTKLSQIFINLINNALKFTENGTITVNTKLIHRNDKNCSLKFEVQDTGIGIPKDKLESIFESFSQGSVEINRKYGGTGLGLTIVKRLVSLMGGRINVSSEIGTGSVFSFNLDFEIGEEIAKPTDFIIKNPKIFINKKILLVEDNKINQMITRKILEKKQIICELCETGEDAILKLKLNKYDLVLMDVHLPGINGTIATEEIRKFDKRTPIIALTAISLDENREMLLSFGMNDVITKPFNPDNLYKIIETNLLVETNIA
ncbi:tetratricopeptide repeat-containing hybrid sensor histidine kinase/response regulator [Flavobacterium humi]|uniref:histidine kinase n=1 Tax=Flavobacterium humi TaxID=2562683 RepID=A0A4Z0L846_9FLAO|nr:ATP-binding protein [Flavobacterium humi]TGD57964.1 response regulator [Flavobacterium humi]